MPLELIEKKIFMIRGHKMMDRDLAELYMVETGALNRAVKRNWDRFPEDFMFQLTVVERENLKCQFGISSWGGDRGLPYAFTEQGVAMLSSVLKSKRAVHVNIQIMRAFVKLRQLLNTHKELARKLEELEKKYDAQFKSVFDAIKMLMTPPAEPDPGHRKIIGFKPQK
ncbi:MAG TPA: DNA-binding protein [Elusimicrobia bacterium]|nr:DNA-binding protein [Elusimicrobiota bacterium]